MGYGSPGKMSTDVGNEFNSEYVKELSEAFNFEVSTGTRYSAWMNGLNERNHGVIDRSTTQIRILKLPWPGQSMLKTASL